MNKYIKKIISGMLALSMFISTIITSNAATDVNVSVNINPKIDIMLTSKDTSLDLSNFETDIKTKLQNKGINTNNINFHTIERIINNFDQQGYTAEEIYNTWEQIPNPSATIVLDGYIINDFGITIPSSNIGYGQSFIFNDSYGVDSITIEAEILNHGCIAPSGFVISNNKKTDTAYMVLVGDLYSDSISPLGVSGASHASLSPYSGYTTLLKIKNFSKAGEILPEKNTILKSISTKKFIPKTTTFDKADGGPGDPRYFPYWYKHFPNDWFKLNVNVSKDGILTAYVNDIEAFTYNIGTDFVGGTGLFFNCMAAMRNVKITTMKENIKTYKDVLTEPTWREDAKHVVVNVDNKIDDTLTGDTTIGEILSRTLADNIHFIQWGSDTNKTVSNNFIKQNDNKGLFTYSSNYNQAVEETTDYIVSLINQESSEQYITIGQDISFSVNPEEYKTGATSNKYPNGRWKINHEYKYFANNLGQSSISGVPIPDLEFNFDKPGKYNILFDDQLVKEVYVHRNPVADFEIEFTGNNTLKLTSTSYDLDTVDGTVTENWYYKKTTDSEWTPGKLVEYDKDSIYMIKLEVEDAQGATSYTTKYVGTGNPVSNFNYANNVVSKYKPLVVNNTSYDPEGYEIVEQEWVLKKNNVVLSTTSEPITNFNIDGLGEGKYTYTLIVKNSQGTISEAFSKSFTIEEDYGKPEVAIGQQGCDWKTSQAVSLEFSDNESEFKNWRYAFTTSPVAPATDEEWSAWSEETTPTVELSGVSGKYYLHIQAYDVANNELTRAVGTYNLDNTEPVINDVKTQKDEINKMFIKVEATDEHSGIVGYAITKAEPMTFNLRTRNTNLEVPTDYQESNILEVTDNGTYNVWVKDSTGNVTVTTYTIEDVNYIGKNTTVYAEIGCEFKVTIPKHIILSGSTKSGAYTVGVEGDIAGTDKIKVVPDESFTLKSTNLNDVTALISQDKTEWSYDQILNDEFKVIGNGEIDAKDITAGSWNGNFNFNIALEGDKVYKNSEPFVEYMDILYNYEVEENN